MSKNSLAPPVKEERATKWRGGYFKKKGAARRLSLKKFCFVLTTTPPTSLRSATSPYRGGKVYNEIEKVEGLSCAPCEGGESQLAGEGVIFKRKGRQGGYLFKNFFILS